MVSKLISILEPLGLAWVFLLAAVGWCVWRGRRRLALGFVLPALILWVGGATPLSYWLLAGLERPFYRTGQAGTGTEADAVVMLGGTHDRAVDEPLPLNLGPTADRITTAVELVRQGRAGVLVLGGGSYEEEGQYRPEAELVMDWLRRWGIPRGEIVSLGICTSTRDEAEKTAALASGRGWRRLILVSSGWHLRRAAACFRRAGLEVLPVGCDFIGAPALRARAGWGVVPDARQLDFFRVWLHEVVGLAWYRWKGWI